MTVREWAGASGLHKESQLLISAKIDSKRGNLFPIGTVTTKTHKRKAQPVKGQSPDSFRENQSLDLAVPESKVCLSLFCLS